MFFLALDIAAIVCSAIFGARVLARHPRLPSAQLIALITFNSICHVVLSRYDYGRWIAPSYRFDVGSFATALNFARNLTPGLFMVLCFMLFSGKTRFPRWLLALFFVQMLLEVPAHWLVPEGGLYGAVALRIAPAVLETLFVSFALYWTIADWRGDLVEGRRRARALVVFIIGFNIIGSSLLLRVLVPQNTLANYDTHLALIAAGLPVLLFLLVFSTDADIEAPLAPERPRQQPEPSAAVSAENAATLARLSALMEAERVYRRPELTVGDLARLVGIPEYRLRRLINEELGYQNFNAFLHDYRIREACLQLRDPEMRRIPILTIALSTGYQSINTFNRGFREIMGMTPSAYRALETVPVPVAPRKISPQTA